MGEGERTRGVSKEQGDLAKEQEKAAEAQEREAEAQTEAAEAEKRAAEKSESLSGKLKRWGNYDPWKKDRQKVQFVKDKVRDKTPGLVKALASMKSKPAESSAKKEHQSSEMGLYILLLLLGLASVVFKKYGGSDSSIHIGLSSALGFIFFIALLRTPEREAKIPLVGIAVFLDIIVLLGMTQKLPDSSFKNILITIHVFTWAILGIILFIWGMIDRWSTGEKTGKGADIILILLIGLVLFFWLPYAWSTLEVQKESYAENYDIAQKQLEKIGTEFKDASNTWGDYLSCFANFMGNPTGANQDACRKEKKIIRYCNSNFKGEEEVKECIQREQGGKYAASGVLDPTIRVPTKFKFVIDKALFPHELFVGDKLSYTVNLEYKNPRKQKINVSLSCNFTNQRKRLDTFLGKIRVYDGEKETAEEEKKNVEIDGEEGSISVTCEAPEGKIKEGSYELFFEAKLIDLETKSRLTRFFIGEKTYEERKKIEDTITKVEGQALTQFAASQAPDDFARLNFGIGNTAKDAIISGNRGVVIGLGIENSGRGELLGVKSCQIDLPGFSTTCSAASCGEGRLIRIPEQKKTAKFVGVPSCFVQSYPEELKNPEDYEKREFTALIKYDYLIRSQKETIIISK